MIRKVDQQVRDMDIEKREAQNYTVGQLSLLLPGRAPRLIEKILYIIVVNFMCKGIFKIILCIII